MFDAQELNNRAAQVVRSVVENAAALRVETHATTGRTVIDCGVRAAGGLEAGLALARACTSDLANVRITGRAAGNRSSPCVEVSTDHPTAACLMSQYAGWQVTGEDFFGMGSGPMRVAACREPMLKEMGLSPTAAEHAVGVLEAGSLPGEEVLSDLQEKCGGRISLLVAPTASQAGNIQILARSVETAMHKLHELSFDPHQVVSGFGTAPLPPVAKDDLTGIGRTNDAILYGARVHLWVRCDDEQICEIGPRVPSNSSPAHGRSFLELFQEANGDFYAIDKHLFSPAVVVLSNLNSGNTFEFGEIVEALALPQPVGT